MDAACEPCKGMDTADDDPVPTQVVGSRVGGQRVAGGAGEQLDTVVLHRLGPEMSGAANSHAKIPHGADPEFQGTMRCRQLT